MKFRRKPNYHQRGSVIITTAIALSLIVICLTGTELGYLFFLKRELQKTADLAALAGAQSVLSNSCDTAQATALDNANNISTGNMPRSISSGLVAAEVSCGTWTEMGDASTPTNRFKVAETNLNAVQVNIIRTPPSLLSFFAADRTIKATATAAKALPRAALEIRSTLVSVDSTKSQTLNSVMGGLLGGSLNITTVGWNGLVSTNLQLLQYVDALATVLNVRAGDYDALLREEASAGQLVRAAISALQAGSNSGSSLSAAIAALEQLELLANINSIKNLTLGELLILQTGNSSALETKLQVFQLAEGIVQLSNSKSAVFISLPLTVPGIGSVIVKTKIIEPPQLSVVGNPQLAKENPTGQNGIFVRTAQVRTLISLDLNGLTGTVNALLAAVTAQLAPLTSFVNDVLKLNLVQAIGNFLKGVLCGGLLGQCPSSNAIYLKVVQQPRMDIGLDVGSASAYVKDFSCSNDEKKLTLSASTALAELRVGTFGDTVLAAETAVFSPKKMTEPRPLQVVEIGQQTVRPDVCALTLCGGLKWKKGNSWINDRDLADLILESTLTIRSDASIAGTAKDLYYEATATTATNLPEINAPTPAYQSILANNVIESLDGTLANVEIKTYRSAASGVLGQVLAMSGELLDNLTKSLRTVIKNVLSPLLDPLLNLLLKTLGIDIAKAEVGARMSCHSGAELVY